VSIREYEEVRTRVENQPFRKKLGLPTYSRGQIIDKVRSIPTEYGAARKISPEYEYINPVNEAGIFGY